MNPIAIEHELTSAAGPPSIQYRPVRRVLLIHPSIRIARESLKFCQMPLGVAYLAAYIRHRFETRVLDATAEGYDHEEEDDNGFFRYGLSLADVMKRVREFSPDVVGISTPFSPTYPVVEDVAEAIKRHDPTIVTMIGGNHPTFLTKECFERPKGQYIDYVALGEGEATLLDLLIAIDQGSPIDQIHGLAYRSQGRLVIRPQKTTIPDVDTIPFPARDLMPLERYQEINVPHIIFSKQKMNTTLFTGRGCPAKCTFCSSTVFWAVQKRMRNRSVENVLDEIGECIEKYGFHEFHIEDDNFTADVKRAKAILQGVIDRGYKIRWSAPNGLAIWTLDEELIRLMKASGVREVVLAFESGDQEVLTRVMHKPLRLTDAIEKVRLVKKYHLRHNAFFMIGMPNETMAQIRKTIQFVKDLDLEAANLFAFFPLPGTAATDLCKKKGYIPEDYDFTQNSSTRGRISTEHFTAEQITSLVRKNWTLQYLRPMLRHPLVALERYGDLLLNPHVLLEIAHRVFGRTRKYVPSKQGSPNVSGPALQERLQEPRVASGRSS